MLKQSSELILGRENPLPGSEAGKLAWEKYLFRKEWDNERERMDISDLMESRAVNHLHDDGNWVKVEQHETIFNCREESPGMRWVTRQRNQPHLGENKRQCCLGILSTEKGQEAADNHKGVDILGDLPRRYGSSVIALLGTMPYLWAPLMCKGAVCVFCRNRWKWSGCFWRPTGALPPPPGNMLKPMVSYFVVGTCVWTKNIVKLVANGTSHFEIL